MHANAVSTGLPFQVPAENPQKQWPSATLFWVTAWHNLQRHWYGISRKSFQREGTVARVDKATGQVMKVRRAEGRNQVLLRSTFTA